MANKIYIDVKVNGNLQKVAVDAKKLSAALQSTGEHARTADRRLKGAAQASSNSTKNFAKMSQGITGGLVPAYATLAANVFAISAAFQFLKKAADYSLLMDSQSQFASQTGLALKSLSMDLQKASGGMLSFSEAAQASAIGAAKGFTGTQMQQIAAGARKASQALGRDFGDSFDRLVRGISKAEPELLDELGITLRLAKATEDYGKKIGKSADDLSAYERSQAVLNATMEQLNNNFGAIEGKTNPFVELGNTFDAIVKSATQFVLPIFQALADIINGSATAAITAFGALGFNILKAALPLDEMSKGIKDIGATTQKYFNDSLDSSKAYVDSLKKQKDAINDIKAARKATLQSTAAATPGTSKLAGRLAAGETLHAGQKAQLDKALKQAEASAQATGTVIKGVFKGASLEQVRALKAAVNQNKTDYKLLAQQIGMQVKRAGMYVKLGFKGMMLSAKLAARGIAMAFQGAMKAVNAAMRMAGFIGMVMMVVEAAQYLYNNVYDVMLALAKGLDAVLNGIVDGIKWVVKWIAEKVKGTWLGDKMGIGEGASALEQWANSADKAYDIAGKLEKSAMGKELKAFQDNRKEVQAQKNALESLTEAYTALGEEAAKVNAGLVDPATSATKATISRATFAANLGITGDFGKQNEIGALKNTEDQKKAYVDFFTKLKANTSNMPNIQKALNFDISSASISQLQSAMTTLGGIQATGEEVVKNNQAWQDSLADLTSAYANFGKTGKFSELAAQIKATQKAETDLRKSAAKEGGTVDTAGAMEAAGATGTDEQRVLALVAAKTALLDREKQLKELAIQNLGLTGLFAEKAAEDLVLKQKQLDLENEELRLKALKLQLESAAGAVARQNVLDDIADSERLIKIKTDDVNKTKKDMDEITKLGKTMGNTLQSSMQSAFEGLIQGTMTAKQAFASLAKSILADIAKMIAKLLVMKMLEASLGGTPLGGFLGIAAPSKRYGGVVSNGKDMPGYAAGGIAKGSNAGYPVMMHGTEAVVPLPNGKSIPVDLKGAGQQNNVTVNVSMSGEGTRTTSDSNGKQGADLGSIIASAVQKELQNQKRSGGILNPYGAS